MHSEYYDLDLEPNNGLLDDEFEIPEAPESWSLDDFNDLVGGADLYQL